MSYYSPPNYGAPNYGPPNSGAPGFDAASMISARPRPGLVSAAAYALFACALMALAGAVTAFAAVTTVGDNLSSVSPDSGQMDSATGHGIMVGYGVIALIVMVAFLLCGFFVLRGRQGMRITTWIVAGLGVLCLGLGAFGSTGNLLIGSGEINTSTSDGQLIRAIPGWYDGTTATLESVTVLVLILVIILLALPSSNAYFRKATAFVMPGYAVAYPGYPGAYPGYTVPAAAYPAATYPAGPYPAGAYPAGAYPAGAYPQYPGYPAYPTDTQAPAGSSDQPATSATPESSPYVDPAPFAPAPTIIDSNPTPASNADSSPPSPGPEHGEQSHSAP